MMKLVTVLCAVALVSSAQGGAVIPLPYSVPSVSYSSSVVHGVGYAAPNLYAARAVSLAQQSPAVVLGPGGVPLDTPEVVAARAQHFQAKALAGSPSFIYTPYSSTAVVLGPGGVPLDTPEVVAARAQHFQAKALAVSGVHSLRKRSIVAPAAVSYSAPLVSTYSAYSAPVASTYAAYTAPVASAYSAYATPVAYTAGPVFPSQAYSTFNVHPY